MVEPADRSDDLLEDDVILQRLREDETARARAADALRRIKLGERSRDVIEPEELERFLRGFR